MSFDINEFLQSQVSEPISATRPQVPAGRWLARIGELDGGAGVEAWIKPPTGNATSPRLDVPFVVLDDTVKAEMGRSTAPTLTQGYWLNVKSGTSQLDSKNNADLGQLLSALKIQSGSPLGMFGQLPGGGPVYVTVAPDRKDPSRMRVVKVEAAS